MPDPTADPAPDARSLPAPVPAWRRALRVGYLVVVVGAFAVAVVARRQELAEQLGRAALVPMVLSAVVGVVGVGVSGLVWRRMLHGLGSALPLGAALKVFFVAQLGKYLPGSLWPVLAQAELGRDHGVPRRSAVAAQALFMWVHLVTGAVLGLPAVAGAGLVPRWVGLVPVLLVPLLLPGPLTATVDWILRRAGRTPLPQRPDTADMLAASGWAVVMWGLYGLHVHLAIEAVGPAAAPGLGGILLAVGVFAAAWTAGFLLLIAPAGAGAREVVLVAGLSAVVGADTAFTVTLVSRLVLTVADGLWGGVGLLAGVGRRGLDAERAGPT